MSCTIQLRVTGSGWGPQAKVQRGRRGKVRKSDGVIAAAGLCHGNGAICDVFAEVERSGGRRCKSRVAMVLRLMVLRFRLPLENTLEASAVRGLSHWRCLVQYHGLEGFKYFAKNVVGLGLKIRRREKMYFVVSCIGWGWTSQLRIIKVDQQLTK